MNNADHTRNTSERRKRSVIYWEELLMNRKSKTSMSDSMETHRASTCSYNRCSATISIRVI